MLFCKKFLPFRQLLCYNASMKAGKNDWAKGLLPRLHAEIHRRVAIGLRHTEKGRLRENTEDREKTAEHSLYGTALLLFFWPFCQSFYRLFVDLSREKNKTDRKKTDCFFAFKPVFRGLLQKRNKRPGFFASPLAKVPKSRDYLRKSAEKRLLHKCSKLQKYNENYLQKCNKTL